MMLHVIVVHHSDGWHYIEAHTERKFAEYRQRVLNRGGAPMFKLVTVIVPLPAVL